MKKKILITGGNGLLGSRTAKDLVAQGADVHLVSRSKATRFVEGAQYHIIDFAKDWKISQLPQNIDAIFHLSQSTEMRGFPEKAEDLFRVNLDSTAKLLEYARVCKVKCFVYASTGGIYGPQPGPIKESFPILSPEGTLKFYFDTKYMGEILIRNYSALMTTVVLRPFFIYGGGQNRNMLIPRLFDNIRAGRAISIAGKEGPLINPIHVSDAAQALIQCLNLTSNMTVNLAGPEIISIKRMSETIARTLNLSPSFEFKSDSPQNAIADIELMSQSLVVPRTRVTTGLKEVFMFDEKFHGGLR